MRVNIEEDWYNIESIEITKRIYSIGVDRRIIS